VAVTVALSDADVVRRIGTGHDREAEGELFRRMAPRVRLYGLRHLRDGHAADDLTQQVLITTIEALRAGRLREPEKLASFVLGTCRMTVLDLRRGGNAAPHLLDSLCDPLASAESCLSSTMTANPLPAGAQGTGTNGCRHDVLRRADRRGRRRVSRSI
jgi:DNA-directed RNA polymerase specialized sigma24 family protein